MAFAADGGRLIVSTAANSATTFALDTGELLALGRGRLTRGWTQEECRQYLQAAVCPGL